MNHVMKQHLNNLIIHVTFNNDILKSSAADSSHRVQ